MRWPLLPVLLVLAPVERRAGLVGAPMKADSDVFVTLAVQFAIMSLLALGGANAVVPEIHRQAVDIRGWMDERQFADMFAISQVAPGPERHDRDVDRLSRRGIGRRRRHNPGDVRPDRGACLIFSARTWDRFKDAPWRIAVQAGLVPISVGLIGASAIVLTRVGGPQLGRRGHHRGHCRDRLLDAMESALADRARRAGRLRRLGLSRITVDGCFSLRKAVC